MGAGVRSAGQVLSRIFAVLGLGLLVVSAVLFWPILHIGSDWRTVPARIVSSGANQSHDNYGRLLFRLEADVIVEPDGSARPAHASSDFATHNPSRIQKVLRKYTDGSTQMVSFRTSQPDKVILAKDFFWDQARLPLYLAIAGLLLWIIAFLVRNVGDASKLCGTCGSPRASYYLFCPGCGATLSADAHRMQHARHDHRNPPRHRNRV